MVGRWHRALQTAAVDPDFVDLIDSRYHQNGLLPPRPLFEDAFGRWLDHRAYNPDSRGDPSARRALREFYAQKGFLIQDDQFFLTAGTSEAYALVFSTLAEAGDSVSLPQPGYPLFEHLARHSRLETVFYAQTASTGWQPDADSLRAGLTPQTRFVVLISPNNPTGQVAERSALEAVAAVCRERDLVLVVDEVFDAGYEGPDLPRPAALFSDLKVLTLNGISKRFGCPDLKLAWIAVTGPEAWVQETVESLELANDTFLSANSFSQALLPDLFAQMDEWQASVRALLAENRREVEAWMCQEPRVFGLLPRGGIHGLWRFDGLPAGLDDESWAVTLLKEEKLALHPGYFYDVQEPGVWLVYSLLKEPIAFREGIRRLARRFSSAVPNPSSRQ